MQILIKNAQIVNEGIIYKSDVLIENQIIKEIGKSINFQANLLLAKVSKIKELIVIHSN